MDHAKTIVRCPSCGAKNRVDRERASKARPKCAKCHGELDVPPMQQAPLVVTDANAQELVDRSPLPVLLDFSSPYCGYCEKLRPTVEKLSREVSDRLRVGVTQLEENRGLAARYGVRATPTLLVLDQGKEVDRVEGLKSEEQLRYRLHRFLG